MAGEHTAEFLDRLQAELLPYLDAPRPLLLAGFSGGRDSLALLWGLHLLTQGGLQGRFRLAAAHFNHNLRGAEAAADEDFCRDFCAGHGIEFFTATAAGLAPGMPNMEQQARAARYNWFAELRRDLSAAGYTPFLLTAHHLEDQAETVLLHLLRGSGGGGLAAMRRRSGWHLRPLLDCPRAEIEQVLAEAGLNWREDSSNACLEHTRNYLRAEVMPRLREINPRADTALARAAEISAAEEEFFAGLLREKMRRAEFAAGGVSYPWADFAAEPLAVRRRLVRELWLAASGRAVCPLTYTQVETVLRLSPGQSLNLSGAVWAARRGKKLLFRAPSGAELRRRQEKSRSGQRREK